MPEVLGRDDRADQQHGSVGSSTLVIGQATEDGVDVIEQADLLPGRLVGRAAENAHNGGVYVTVREPTEPANQAPTREPSQLGQLCRRSARDFGIWV